MKWEELISGLVFWGGAACVVLVALVVSGVLRSREVGKGGERDVPLGGIELAVGLGLYFAGSVAAVMALGALGVEVGGERELSGSDWAWLSGASIVGQVPAIAFVLMRVNAVPGGLRKLGVTWDRPVKHALMGILGVVACYPVLTFVGVGLHAISKALEIDSPTIGHDLLRVVRDLGWGPERVLLISFAVIGAPVAEEIIFRGMVQTSLGQTIGWQRRWTSIVLASVLFSLIHFGVPWQSLVALFLISLVFGYLYERTGSLLTPIVAHVVFNAVNIALVLAGQGVEVM